MQATRTCTVDGCDRIHYGHGYCQKHWHNWRRTGDPLPTPRPMICTVDDCDGAVEARGWCLMHYKRWRRNGKTEALTVEDRFFAKITGQTDGGCWIWHRLDPAGYGAQFASGSHLVLPHRWAYEFLRVEIPDGLVIDHLCENRACVNPWHLEPVTQQENVLRGYHRAPEYMPPT